MINKKLRIFLILTIFCIGITISSVSAIEDYNSTDNLTSIDEIKSDSLNTVNNQDTMDNLSQSKDSVNLINEKDSIDNLSKSEEDTYLVNEKDSIDNLSKSEISDWNNCLSINQNASSEILSLNLESQDEVLSSSISTSSNKGHTYHINGYTFAVSASQYAKIKKAIKMGKKHDWLDSSFHFKVKTNKIHTYKKPIYKTKKVKKYKWKYKKLRVSQEKYWDYEWCFYTNQKVKGWTCYKLKETDYEYGIPHKHYVYLKKKVKYTAKKKVKTGKYKKVKMRIYADIRYIGYDEYETGEWSYYPWVDFNAMKKGYSTKFLSEALLR